MSSPKSDSNKSVGSTKEFSIDGNTSNVSIKQGSDDFLNAGTPLPNIVVNHIENQPQENYEEFKSQEVIKDIVALTKTDLRNKYPLTYSRWRNMKSRKKEGAIIDSRFHDFTDFLGYMGPVPNRDYTLDRIDNNDPTYSPYHCRWADKYTQNSNKGNNVFVTYEGKTHTIAQWATLTNQKPNTLYKRKKEGWADNEVVTGIREKIELSPWSKTPWPKGKELTWERLYQRAVFASKDTSRLDFLIDTSERKLQELDHESRMAWEEDDEIPKALIVEEDYWKILFKTAKELKIQQERRKKFIARYGNNDPIEAALFDLLNPNPMTFENISTISREQTSESTSNQEESSE